MAVMIEELEQKKLTLHEHAKGLIAAADAENRELTEEEQRELDRTKDDFKSVELDIQNRREIAEQERKLAAPEARKTKPDVDEPEEFGQRRPLKPSMRLEHDTGPKGQWGWRNVGQFAGAVRLAARGTVDPRLIMNAPTTFGSESAQADGGYALPPDFRQQIMLKVQGEGSLLAQTDQQTTSSNQLTVPVDETTPWATSGGIQVNWEQEGSAATQTKPAIQQATVRCFKLRALIPITEELLEDVTAMSNYLGTKLPQKFTYALNDVIVNGTGTGQPLGLLNSPAKVTVTKESGQATLTVNAANVLKMWGRCYGPWRQNGVWLLNQDVEQQLQQMTIGSAGWPAYLPPGGLAGTKYGTLLGRPCILTEACKSLTTEGDIILTDLNQYLSVVKAGGLRQEVSIHLWFDFDMTAFKFTMRMGGQPWWSSAITRKSGTNTLSSIVTLQSR